MPGTREIKAKIKSLKGTKRITSAMKAVSAAKLRKAQEELFSVRPYAEVMKGIAQGLFLRENPALHPILAVRNPVRRVELVVITSDKGLCGAFNANIVREVNRFAREKQEAGVELSLTTVGNKACQFFTKYSSLRVRREIRDTFRRIGLPLAEEIAGDLYLGYLSEYFDEVYLVYNRFVNALTQRVTFEKILPLDVSPGEEPVGEYLIGPEEGVVESAIMSYVSAVVLRALKESETSEHSARMTAMDNATKNAEELIRKLTISFNKARQAAITKELIEITTAIEAMK
jgi:F-type H+-transporting ATPase subunit gamma